MKNKIALLLILVLTATCYAQEKFEPEWENLNQHKASPEWFADAKLGVYFHWGVYNVPANGNEWYDRYPHLNYLELYRTPDPKGWLLGA